MNPTARRIIRTEQIDDQTIDAIWDDGEGNRYRVAVMRNGEFVW